MQKDDPEEDMDVQGGGQAAEDRRIVKEEDYGSDNDADFMEEDRPQQHQQAQHAQQAAGFDNNSRGGTPGRGSLVRFNIPFSGPVYLIFDYEQLHDVKAWSQRTVYMGPQGRLHTSNHTHIVLGLV